LSKTGFQQDRSNGISKLQMHRLFSGLRQVVDQVTDFLFFGDQVADQGLP